MATPANTHFVYNTPLGPVTIASDGESITHLAFGRRPFPGDARPTELTNRAANELQEYFAGKRRAFDLPLSPSGTSFQQSVWRALQNIPYGQTRSYQDIAQIVGRPTATRAVGSANNKNPIAVLIPCHRVIGKNGKLTGYAAGVALKERLLEIERNNR